MRLPWVVLLTLLALPLPALAHGDQRIVDGVLTIPPGEVASFDGEVHYHRIVGRFDATGSILVSMIESGSEGSQIVVGSGRQVALNHLIACCDGAAWTRHTLAIENVGPEPVTVSARASLVHDDIAVSVFRAESGVVESMLALGAVWAFVLRRRRQKGIESTRRKANTTLFTVASAVLALAAYGTVRYGAGSVPGLLAGLADVPILPMNPLASRASVLLLLTMVGWAIAGARWAAARPAMTRARWLAHGAALVAMVLLSAVLVSTTYGTPGLPLMISVLAAGPLAVLITLDGRPPYSEHRTPAHARGGQ